MQALYQQVILDHARRPRGAGLAEGYDVEVRQVNPTCGDEIVLRLRLRDGVIAHVSHHAQGCSISVAAASVMTEQVCGQPVPQAMAAYDAIAGLLRREPVDRELLGDGEAFEGVAQFPARVKCALLPWTAMKQAVLTATDREMETKT